MILKCKMCGGDIRFALGDTYGKREFCDSMCTIPEAEDEMHVNRYNRANHLRRQCEFDKAAAAYGVFWKKTMRTHRPAFFGANGIGRSTASGSWATTATARASGASSTPGARWCWSLPTMRFAALMQRAGKSLPATKTVPRL